MNEKTYRVLDYNTILQKLADLTSCDSSRSMAINLCPIIETKKINELLDETDDAVSFVIRRGSPPLMGIKDIRPSVRRADSGASLSLSELLGVAGVLKVCRRMLDYSSTVDENVQNRMAIMISSLTEDRKFEERITTSILSEDEISDDASPELHSIRRQIVDRQTSIKEKLNEIIRSSKYSKSIQEQVITVRGDRYCIPVKSENRNDIPGMVHDTSSSGQTLFVEPAAVVDANNKIRELRVSETHEIARIIAELSAETSNRSEILLNDFEILTYLDFTFAKARYALEIKGSKPKINENGYINLINARHPLIEKNNVVPIDFHIGEDFTSLIITGPNTGGKTVTLKTVGLFTLMMQSGLFISADVGSSMSVFNGIFADIGDEQSIAQNLSTFSSHMKNIVEILSNCDYRSLILFDELGAGTDPTEGAALAMSILECVHQTGCTTLATTHYSEIKVFAATTKGFANACCEFDVETLRPTYKLLIGVPGKSNAFAISEKIGLDSEIISRAKEFLSGEDLRFEDMLMSIEKNRSIIQSEKEEAERLRLESDRIKDNIKKEQDSFFEQKNNILTKSREEARILLSEARIKADKLLSDIRKASLLNGSGSVKEAEIAKQELVELQKNIASQLHKEYINTDNFTPPKTVKEGDNVRIVSLGGNGVVLKGPDKDNKVFIQAGIMKVYVQLDDLILQDNIKDKINNNKRKTGNVPIKAATIKTELDVRGLTVDEAVSYVDKYLDDADLAHMDKFSIIHGKGTGALRTGIHRYLNSNKRIKEFRIGSYGEGDAGVTIVTLK